MELAIYLPYTKNVRFLLAFPALIFVCDLFYCWTGGLSVIYAQSAQFFKEFTLVEFDREIDTCYTRGGDGVHHANDDGMFGLLVGWNSDLRGGFVGLAGLL